MQNLHFSNKLIVSGSTVASLIVYKLSVFHSLCIMISFSQKFVAVTIGNVMEWYDFAVFGSFADIIAVQFFPGKSSKFALLKSFAVFGAAFYARPLGVGFAVMVIDP